VGDETLAVERNKAPRLHHLQVGIQVRVLLLIILWSTLFLPLCKKSRKAGSLALIFIVRCIKLGSVNPPLKIYHLSNFVQKVEFHWAGWMTIFSIGEF